MAARIAGKIVEFEGQYVANGPIHDHTRAAVLLQVTLHDLAQYRVGQITARIHHQHVTGSTIIMAL